MNFLNQVSLARGISEFGNAFRFIAIPIALFGITQSQTDLAFIQFIITTGLVFGSFTTLSLIDRFDKVKTLIILDIISLCFTLLACLGTLLRLPELIFTAAFGISFISSFHVSALDATTADFVEKINGNTIRGFSYQDLMIITFSIIGGYLAAITNKFPIWSFFLIDAITFIISSVWVLLLVNKNHKESAPVKIKRDSFLKNMQLDFNEGIDYLLKNRDIKKHIVIQFSYAICFGLLASSIDAHLLSTLHWDQTLFKSFGPTNKIFYILGALSTFALPKEKKVKFFYTLGSILVFIGYLGLSFSPITILIFIFYGIQQFGTSFINPANKSLVVFAVPSNRRGRLASFRKLSIDIGLLVGTLISTFVIRFSTFIPLYLSAGTALFAFVILLSIRNWYEKS